MAMVEGRDDLKRLRKQHPVAEDIARHIAATDDADGFALHVDAGFGKVALDRKPRALGRDAHRFVIITDAAPRSERVAEPEIAVDGNGVGYVGEGRGALVGSDHEIGIVTVVDDDLCGMDDLSVHDIVGDRQKRADENTVTFGALGQPRRTVGNRVGQEFGIKSAFGARWHDHCVLDALRFHKPQNFGAEIVTSVGPAQAAARDRAGAQMDALNTVAVNPDFAPRHGRGKAGDERAVKLEGNGLAGGWGIKIGAQRCPYDTAQPTQNAVIVNGGHRAKSAFDLAFDVFCAFAMRRVMVCSKQRDDRPGQRGLSPQRIDDGRNPVGHPRLAQIAKQRPEQDDIARAEVGCDQQLVETVVFGSARHGVGNRGFDDVGAGEYVGGGSLRQIKDKAVHVAERPVECRRHFLDHAEAEIFERRHSIGQDHGDQAVEFQAQPLRSIFGIAIQTNIARRDIGQAVKADNVECGFGCPCPGAVGNGKGGRIADG